MKYKLLQPIPWYGVWYEIDTDDITQDKFCKNPDKFPDFFGPIVEKKTYDDLTRDDNVFFIHSDGSILEKWYVEKFNCRSETFLTREEAEDENKRREWAVRKDKFVPWFLEPYYCPYTQERMMQNDPDDFLIINSWLAFKTREDCQDAIDNHDLIRLFYNIR